MIQNALLAPLKELESYNKLLSTLARNARQNILCTGAIDSQKVHLAWALAEESKRPLVVITFSELRAREIVEDLSFFTGDNAKAYPAESLHAAFADAKSKADAAKRLEILAQLCEGRTPALALSAEALTNNLTPPEVFKQYVLELEVGEQVNTDELLGKLGGMGYERVELAENAGQFAMRGGIIDICGFDGAARIELWGDEVDSIRVLDPYTQRSTDKLEKIRIHPAQELVYDRQTLSKAVRLLEDDLSKTRATYEKRGLLEESRNLGDAYASALETLQSGRPYSGINRLAGYFYDKPAMLLDYLPENAILFFDEPARIAQHCNDIVEEFHSALQNRILLGQMLPERNCSGFAYARALERAADFDCVLLASLAHNIKDFYLNEMVDIEVKSSGMMQRSIEALESDLRFLISRNERVLLLAGGKTRASRLLDELVQFGIPARNIDLSDEGQTLIQGQVCICEGSLLKGFAYPMIGLNIISGKEMFEPKRRKRKKFKKAAKIDSFAELHVGDYVVHDIHGIGIYQGIEKISADGVSRDYLKISYGDGGNLYITTNDLDVIQKYIGGDDAKPKLNKLGGGDWKKAKARVRKEVEAIAKDLVELYAKREQATGFAFSEDTVWQAEFEEMFPYEETEDQLAAIKDVKRDMESARVMDRLICGDVGYGKTEIAIRAAFKAAMDSKQVAMLVPTTILAQQHYNNFVQRMKDFPVTIELLSRFRTPAQQRQSLQRLQSGQADIIIGTHRLLSKDVMFKDLGLIVVDEEQRFGVKHKEKLKTLRENVDVLTLSATPIPRTLHMSLTGIRDMSVLEEPPEERTPVETYVMEYNPAIIREAVLRELARDGQVYYLHNRVRSIAETTRKLQQLIPEATVAFAHGKMSEREMENIMMDFIEGEIDVLVCTTIIESGLDIPNVNTMIVQDADNFGLSQLYQLRGRVGRSNRSSYAYLMYRRDKLLTEHSEKRLQTIREFTEFGAGFKIAMRDMEIRGVGNLLGEAQHGHMDSVGYDMYCKLLKEAVDELRGFSTAEQFETSVNISINAFIPDFYIEDEQQKLEMYKKIALLQNDADYDAVYEELEDRFGDLPNSVINLLDVARLKAAAHSIGVTDIADKGNTLIISLKPDAKVEPQILANLIRHSGGDLLFTISPAAYLTYRVGKVDGAEKVKLTLNLMQQLAVTASVV